VEVATIDSGRVIARDTIDASGAETPVASEGCTGSRSGKWSADGRRVYLRSELNCSGGITRVSSGILAFASSSEWLDVQSVRAGSSSGTRATRYAAAEMSDASAVPAEFAGIFRSGSAAGGVARLLAGGEVGPGDVIDASRQVDAETVETWLIERGMPFDLDGKTLTSLADAGVPGSVTDVMVGVSFPDQFALTRGTESGYADVAVGAQSPGASSAGVPAYVYTDPRLCSRGMVWDPSWYPQSAYDSCYGSDRYWYGYGYGGYYGYGAYGYSSPIYTGYYNTPVVVVDRGKFVPHGKMVKGQGYTRSRPPESTRSNEGSGSSQSGSSGPQRRSGSSSGKSSGSSSSGGGRTAHKKGG
jgi:hypothetical protein